MKKYIKKSIFIGIFSIIGIMGTGNKLYAEPNFRQWYADDKTEKIETELADVYSNPSHATAVKHMVWVEVPVWNLKNGKKVSSRARIQVLNLLADEVKEIFTEIYNGPEKFPIKSVGGYNWRPNGIESLHSLGRAIDINPDENPQLSPDGVVLVGKKWEPYQNPYSITPEGDVVRAFTSRGWVWGANYTRPDYMHFDFPTRVEFEFINY
ncbi:M15 family metallopeptidase [Leptotrichia buccalis]